MFATVAEPYRNEELYDTVEVEPQGHSHMEEESTILEVVAKKTRNHIMFCRNTIKYAYQACTCELGTQKLSSCYKIDFCCVALKMRMSVKNTDEEVIPETLTILTIF